MKHQQMDIRRTRTSYRNKKSAKKDWVKMRVYASILSSIILTKYFKYLFYSYKLIKKNIKDIFEDLINLRQIKQYQTLSNIVTSIHDHANSILTGGSEFRLKKIGLKFIGPQENMNILNY